jgi:PAS domain S-box-containing protein
MNFFALLDFLKIFVTIYIGVLVYQKDSKPKVNRLFILLNVMGAYSSFCEFFLLTAINEELVAMWNKLNFVWPFFPFVSFQIVLALINIRGKKYTILSVVLLIPAIIFSFLHVFVSNILYFGVKRSWFGWEVIHTNDPFGRILSIYLLIIGSISLFLMFRYYKKQTTNRQKKQALYILIGLSVPVVMGFLLNGILPRFGIHLQPLNAFAYAISAILIAISILKYNFLSINPLDTIRKLFSTITDYMFICDSEGTILISSASLLKSLKYNEEDVIGRKIEQLIHSKNSALVNGLLDLPGKEFEISLISKNNEPIPVSVTVSIIQGEMHKDALFLLLARDLRERKRFEEELLSMQKSLEEKVKVRTADLSKALIERETLLKEIHHRVKNNLQIISSLLYLQSQNATDAATMKIFNESQNRVRAMALIHEQLYLSKDFSKIEFSYYIKNLSDIILSSYNSSSNNIRIIYDLEEIDISLDLTIPLGLILNELLTNACKYAFNVERKSDEIKENIIWVRLNKIDNKKCILAVTDNGKGLPKNFTIDSANSLGLRLVSNLANQIEGKFEFFSTDMTVFNIYFPGN